MSSRSVVSAFRLRVKLRRTTVALAKVVRRTFTIALLLFASVVPAGAQSAIVDAIKAGDAAHVRALIDKRVDVNVGQQDGTTPLHWAVDRDRPDIVQMLIRAGANVKAANRYGATPLWLALVNGNPKTIAMLLEGGADAGSANADGETAL